MRDEWERGRSRRPACVRLFTAGEAAADVLVLSDALRDSVCMCACVSLQLR